MKPALSVLLLILAAANLASAQQAPPYDDRPKITVDGEAVINVTPDKIIITCGIETWAAQIDDAKQKSSALLKKAIEVSKESGVREEDIATDYLSIEPRYKDEYEKENFIGYFVRNTFSVTQKDPARVEELISKLLAAGIKNIHNVDFQTTEFKQYREQARELALKAAKEKAEKMSAALGQAIGSPLSISEEGAGSSSWYYSSWWGWNSSRQQSMSQNVMQNASGGGGGSSDTIALGKISIRAKVNVVFELKR